MAIKSWLKVSINEPYEISRKRICSFSDFRPLPSAMLDGTDTTALRIWSHNAYFSNLGNSSSK